MYKSRHLRFFFPSYSNDVFNYETRLKANGKVYGEIDLLGSFLELSSLLDFSLDQVFSSLNIRYESHCLINPDFQADEKRQGKNEENPERWPSFNFKYK